MSFVAQKLHWFVAAAAVVFLLAVSMPPADDDSHFRLHAFSTIPVQDNGRIKPIDTVARNDMMLISHRQYYVDANGNELPAIRWMLDAMTHNPDAADAKIFRIENDSLVDRLGLKPRQGFRYSFNEIKDSAYWEKLVEEYEHAQEKKGKGLSVYEEKLVDLGHQLGVYLQLQSGREDPHVIPTGSVYDDWQSLVPAAIEMRDRMEEKAAVNLYTKDLLTILDAYRHGKVEDFNSAVGSYQKRFADDYPGVLSKAEFEAAFNHGAPFYYCMYLYVAAFLLVCLGWLGIPLPLNRAAFWLIIVALSAHMLGLFARMYITERPLVFVTNLYSSAVFIGSMSVVLGLILEYLFPLGIGNCVAAVLGFLTLLIAHNLAASGDTIEAMQAVLNTNFWLASHVTAVTLGYTATFVAGAIGLVFVFMQIRMVVVRFLDGARDPLARLITYTVGLPFLVARRLRLFLDAILANTALQSSNGTAAGAPAAQQVAHGPLTLDKETIRVFGRLIYGIVCFATLLSFVGTVLGGIWADQSWGRFWGWDPKENGALIIVIWNALILHARWCGLVQSRGMAALSLGGNIVTSWSWFGVNMLGVGLHSYGFMDGAVFWLLAWIGLNLLMIAVCMMPTYLWRDDAQFKKPVEPMMTKPGKPRKGKKRARSDAVTTASPVFRMLIWAAALFGLGRL
jgi:ABC-type transport system involved in cytochrome c biogenesis permease subunit